MLLIEISLELLGRGVTAMGLATLAFPIFSIGIMYIHRSQLLNGLAGFCGLG